MQLGRALWVDGTQSSQAAVMIGAGFSRNADAVAGHSRPFPTWSSLTERMVGDVYPANTTISSDVVERARLQSRSTSGALRLAQEYEAYFGRTKLDELLQAEIPDQSYRPGRIHQLLLELPWSDVLTTNYDTLLERTTLETRRHYSLVLTPSDLTTRMRPRIIKLHGSFPSHRPFIVTEEDFRTYPRRFAAFVNVAQQIFVENVVCMFGFSGDDPNFLQWTGWARDHLASSVRQVYLCGILELTPSQRKVLEDRSVIPIDLAPLLPVSEFPRREERHFLATEWALAALRRLEPPNTMNWPNANASELGLLSANLPPLPPLTLRTFTPEPMSPP